MLIFGFPGSDEILMNVENATSVDENARRRLPLSGKHSEGKSDEYP
jgi:hypothetical protein